MWPVFDFLFRKDPTGASWLPALLGLGERAEALDSIDPGPLLPELVKEERRLPAPIVRAIGTDAAIRVGKIRNAFEADIPPSEAFLRWLIAHPNRLTWPRSGGDDLKYGDQTHAKRKLLISGDAGAREEALSELASFGAKGSQRKWWAFEGFTSADCYLETESLLLLIEGKRTETVAESTSWFSGRNQVIRNLEVAKALSGGRKNFAVLLCAEGKTQLSPDCWAMSLPHFSPDEVEDLKRHYLGCVLWSDIVKSICPSLRLPETLNEAIEDLCKPK